MSGEWVRLDTLDGWTLDGPNVVYLSSGTSAMLTAHGHGPNGPDLLVFYRSWVSTAVRVTPETDGRVAVVYKQVLTEAQEPSRPAVDSPYKVGDSVWIKGYVYEVGPDGMLEVTPKGEMSYWETWPVHPDDVRPVTPRHVRYLRSP